MSRVELRVPEHVHPPWRAPPVSPNTCTDSCRQQECVRRPGPHTPSNARRCLAIRSFGGAYCGFACTSLMTSGFRHVFAWFWPLGCPLCKESVQVILPIFSLSCLLFFLMICHFFFYIQAMRFLLGYVWPVSSPTAWLAFTLLLTHL